LPAACERLWFATRLDGYRVRGCTAGTVWIGQLKAALVFGTGLQIENAAGKAVGNRVVEMFAATINIFAADAQQRQSLPPCRFAHCAKLDRHRCVAIRITADFPFEAEIHERGMFDNKAAGRSAVIGSGCGGGQYEK